MGFVIKVNTEAREIHLHQDSCSSYRWERRNPDRQTGEWSQVFEVEDDAYDYAEAELDKLPSATIFSACPRCPSPIYWKGASNV